MRLVGVQAPETSLPPCGETALWTLLLHLSTTLFPSLQALNTSSRQAPQADATLCMTHLCPLSLFRLSQSLFHQRCAASRCPNYPSQYVSSSWCEPFLISQWNRREGSVGSKMKFDGGKRSLSHFSMRPSWCEDCREGGSVASKKWKYHNGKRSLPFWRVEKCFGPKEEVK